MGPPGRPCTAGGGASARCGPRRIPAGSGGARSPTAVPRNLPGLPPVRGRRGRMPAGSTPRSCGSPPDAAGRRDPPRAFPVLSADSQARSAGRRPPASPRARRTASRPRAARPPRSPGPPPPARGARLASGRAAGARGRPPKATPFGQTAARTPLPAAGLPPAGSAGRGFRGADSPFKQPARRAAVPPPETGRFPRPGLAEPHPTRSRGRRLACAPGTRAAAPKNPAA